MAEVLGIVASGLSVARVSGSILTNSLKLKALLDEVKDAPESLGYTLQYLELLTPILSEFTANGCDIPTTVSSPPHPPSNLQQGMQNAFAACRKAAEQLELLVTELKSDIDGARGGLRRKRAMVKVVLKKATLEKYEARLRNTVQFLTIVQNACIFALQRRQPEIIVSQVVGALNQSYQHPHGHLDTLDHQASSNSQVPAEKPDRRAPSTKTLSPLQKYSQLGISKVTGVVRIQSSPNRDNRQSQHSENGIFLRIQVHMPTWLGAAVFDSSLSRNYTGWTYSLNVYGKILKSTEEYDLVRGAIKADNVDAMCHLFQERRCGPKDHLVKTWGRRTTEYSMLQMALAHDAWKVAEYLLGHGAESGEAWVFGGRGTTRTKQSEPLRERILQHDMLNDRVRIHFLASCPDDMSLFTSLVGRVWPGNAFYDAALVNERFGLAMSLVRDCGRKDFPRSPEIFRHLCGSLALKDMDVGSTMSTSSCLAQGVGKIVWLDPVSRARWHHVIKRTALRLNNFFLMPDQQPREWKVFPKSSHSAMLFDKATTFTNLFLESMMLNPDSNDDPNQARRHKITCRLYNCQRGLHAWLDIIRSCGIDLLEYGIQTKRFLREVGGRFNFAIYRDVWFDSRDSWKNGLFKVRLISFTYGSHPEDWKLWWSEPTDGLVGDFWREIEPEPLCIPGSWVED